MRRECQERFPHHCGLATPARITARVWPLSDKRPVDFLSDSGHVRAVMHAVIAVSFYVGGGEDVPGIPGTCACAILRKR